MDINEAWKRTCKVLFGEGIGKLADCSEWLREYDLPLRPEKSVISGKIVTVSLDDYAAGSKFIAFDEVDFGKKFEPLNINDIKDIDSIVEAVGERVQYSGSICLGNSSNVQNSNNVIDSHYVLESSVVTESKYVAYSRYVGYSEYCFGLLGADRDIHAIKCHGSELRRCFECHMVELLSDCYYCAKAQNCRDCMFCFGMENGAYAVGNSPLPKEKYAAIKSKLLSEIVGKIKKEKKIFSLLEIIEKCGGYAKSPQLMFEKAAEPAFDMTPLERAFRQTTSLLLGKEMQGMNGYSGYLNRHVPQNVILKSSLSGSKVVNCGHRAHILKRYDISERMATDDEMREIGRMGGLVDPGRLSADLEVLAENLHPIAYINLDKVAGQAINLCDVSVVIDTTDGYNGCAFVRSKKCAHCHWPSDSEAVFGSSAAFESSYCISTYYSKRMTRSFECDSCESCSDCYFCHNCENVRDSMFCFNAKNLKYAIGNVEVGREKYLQVKKEMLGEIVQKLERDKQLDLSIYNIGCKPQTVKKRTNSKSETK